MIMWREGSDDLGRAIAPALDELEGRLEIDLDERDRLAIVAALTKAAILGYREGFNTVRESAVLDAAIQGVELKLDATLMTPDYRDVWEAYVADEG
jgi:hypothetical protein